MADKATQELERIYTIPLRDVKSSPRNHQADRAIRHIKKYLRKHMKSEDVWIDASVNEKIWARGMYTVPSRIRVRARKFDDGVIEVSLPDLEVKDSIRGEIAARKEKAEEGKERKKEEAKEEKATEAKPKADTEETAKPEAKQTLAIEPHKKVPWSERKVIDIEGIGPKFDAELAKVNVRLMDQLLAADAADLAKKTSISLTLLQTWQGMADLDRLDTINNQYAELLVRAGIDRVKKLSALSPTAIVEKANAYLKSVERPPTRQPVTEAIAEEWVKEARKLAGQA